MKRVPGQSRNRLVGLAVPPMSDVGLSRGQYMRRVTMGLADHSWSVCATLSRYKRRPYGDAAALSRDRRSMGGHSGLDVYAIIP